MTAAEIFEFVTNGGASDFSAIVKILNQNQPWCLIGGLAVNCYVEPIYTIDADIVVLTDRLPQVSQQLEQAGFQIQKFEHSINAKRRTSQLRIQFTTDARYQDFLASKGGARSSGTAGPGRNSGKCDSWEDLGLERPKPTGQQTKERRTGLASDRRKLSKTT